MKATITQKTDKGNNIYIENINILCTAEATQLRAALQRSEERNETLLRLLYRFATNH